MKVSQILSFRVNKVVNKVVNIDFSMFTQRGKQTFKNSTFSSMVGGTSS